MWSAEDDRKRKRIRIVLTVVAALPLGLCFALAYIGEKADDLLDWMDTLGDDISEKIIFGEIARKKKSL